MASSEALDVLYWAMRPASYRCIAMAIEIAIDSDDVGGETEHHNDDVWGGSCVVV